MLSRVIDTCAELLATPPDEVLPVAIIGARRPSSGADVPAITLALVVEGVKGYGAGRFAYSGVLAIEIWASNLSQIDEIARKLQGRLSASAEPVRHLGFSYLQPASLDPAQHMLHTPPQGSPFAVWQQGLSYRFVFE